MAFDGLVISNIVSELKEKVLLGRIVKIYQPEPDELLLNIKNQKNNYKLLISAKANLPLIYFTQQNKNNPLTPFNFCMLLRKHLNNGKIVAIEQPDFERIIVIHIEHLDEMGDLCTKKLIIEIMGRHSNIIFCDNNDNIIDSIKHISKYVSSVREVLPGVKYLQPPSQNKYNPLNIEYLTFYQSISKKSMPIYKALYTSLTGISPLIAEEICFRSRCDSSLYANTLDSQIYEKMFDTLCWLRNVVKESQYCPNIIFDNDKPIDFSSIMIKGYSNYYVKSYVSISEVLDNFYQQKLINTRIKQKSVDLRKLIQNILERCYKKYDLQLSQLKDTEKRDKLKLYGELLIAYAHQIEEGAKKLETINYYTNEPVCISLDSNLTPTENSQKYYKKYNKLKRTYEALQEQIKETKKEIEHLESIQNALDIAEDESDLQSIRKELVDYGYIKKKTKDKKNKIATSKPLHYISSDGFHMYVGKNNFQNDELSLKFASNNDWWFHTKEIPGSHVIVKVGQKKLSDKAFEEAASLAAYYSKARNSSKVAVDYTLKKNLKKPNGSKPGYVIYHTNYSIYVEPSIKNLKLVTTEK